MTPAAKLAARALRPFAKASQTRSTTDRYAADDLTAVAQFKVGDLRRAADALSALEAEQSTVPEDRERLAQHIEDASDGCSTCLEAAAALRLSSHATGEWRPTLEAIACLHDEGDINDATHLEALRWADAMKTFPAPLIFSHGGDSVVFKWGERLFLTITDEGTTWYDSASGLRSMPAPPSPKDAGHE